MVLVVVVVVPSHKILPFYIQMLYFGRLLHFFYSFPFLLFFVEAVIAIFFLFYIFYYSFSVHEREL